MAFLFGRSRKGMTQELVRSTKELMTKLATDENLPVKSEQDLTRNLTSMKVTLQGTPEVEVNPESVLQLCNLLVVEDLLKLLAENVHRLPFEARKDTQTIISNVFRFVQPGSESAEPVALQYVITNRPEIIIALCHGYDRRESAMPCGGILKEALKYDAVTALVLYHEPSESGNGSSMDLSSIDTSQPTSGKGVFWRFFDWIDNSPFEVSADAFDTFRQILVKHRPMVSTYITTNFELFFEKYNNTLIQSSSYVTKRQSTKLLGEILLDRHFYDVMTRYVAIGPNLQLIMNQLKDDRRMVQYEGFHVFKIFVANPNKSPEVYRILCKNKARLLKFLPKFLEDRTDDQQFADEKAYLIRQIGLLPELETGVMNMGVRET